MNDDEGLSVLLSQDNGPGWSCKGYTKVEEWDIPDSRPLCREVGRHNVTGRCRTCGDETWLVCDSHLEELLIATSRDFNKEWHLTTGWFWDGNLQAFCCPNDLTPELRHQIIAVVTVEPPPMLFIPNKNPFQQWFDDQPDEPPF